MGYNETSIFDKSCDMTDWKTYPLYDLAKWNNGLAFRNIDFSTEGIPVVKIAELKNGITSQTQFTNTKLSENARLEYGDMLFSWSGNPETSIDVFWFSMPSGWLNQHIFKLIPAEFMDKHYLFYILKYLKPQFTAIAKNKQTTGLGHVTVSDLKKIVITIPVKSIQHTIAATLSCLDDKIELNNKINANLEAQAQAIFKSWFVNFEPFQDGEFVDSELGQIPKGWRVVPFTEIVDVLGGGTPKTDVPEYWNGTIPFFTPKDVSGAYTISTQKTLTQQGIKNCNSRLYPQNTVFITARGTVGKVTLAGNNMAMNQSCYALRSKHPYSQYFIYQLTLGVVDALKNKATGAVFDAIVTRDFENETVVLPHIDVITKYTSIVEPMFKLILKNLHESKTLSHIRDGMLPRLMSGEIEIKHLDNRLER